MTTATVEITGLPENCSRTASASFIIRQEPPIVSMKIVESNIPLPRIQKAELDILFVELNNDPSAIGYILERFQPSISPLLLVQKFTSLFRGISFRKYPIDRIKFFVTSGNKSLIEMWVSPIGAQSPPFEDVEVLAEITPQNYKKEIAKIFSAKQTNISKKPKGKN